MMALVRSTLSSGRPNAEDTCSRWAIRLTSAVRLVPAPWNKAGLKNTASPLASGNCTQFLAKYAGRPAARYRGTYFCECGRYIVGPVSTGMPQCATARCRVSNGDNRCTCSG